MVHRNAPLAPEGRRRLCERVDAGRPICHVAAEAGIARQTLGKWYARWLEAGEDGLLDRSSRPDHSPGRTPVEVEDRVVALRRERKVGPVQLVGLLVAEGIVLAASTVHQILVRRGISRLRDLDTSGADLREPIVRYEWDRPGDLIHVDVKKFGRIPDSGGWPVHGRGSDQDNAARRHRRRQRKAGRPRQAGYVYLHSAVDDHSRLTYTEELPDEKAVTAAAFWLRAVEFFARHGITHIERVLTDNGACYRSVLFNAALVKTHTRHKHTRPYRPQTQRQGRTLPPHPRPGMGLRQHLDQQRHPNRRPEGLPQPLQLPSTPHRARRQTTRQPHPERCHQPRRLEQQVTPPRRRPDTRRGPGGVTCDE